MSVSRSLIGRAWRLLRLGLVAYLVVVLILMWFEERLIFFPMQYPAGDWSPASLELEDVWFTADDGTSLHGWYVPHPNPRAIILYAHGNAGNITHRADVLRLLRDELEVSTLIFDYRGYGRSSGSANEQGVLADARAARDWLSERTGHEPAEIVLLGRSIGGAVAVHLAAEDGARGLVLESTFTSLPDVAGHHYPLIPTQWLMRNRLNAAEAIADYRGPLLQSHGTADRIVPMKFGAKLFETAPSTSKTWLEIPGRGHNDPQTAEYYRALDTFLVSLPDREQGQ